MGIKKILIVDDEEDLLKILGKRLSAAGYQVLTAKDGIEALNLAKEVKPHLIILDVMIPELDGLKVKAKLNSDALTANIPVIFLTVKSTIADKIKGFHLGADDYITKPFNSEELLARIYSVLNRRQFYEEISMRDRLTELYNINFFKKQFNLFFNMAKRYKRIFSLVIVDIDNFNKINDNYGYLAGDSVLKNISMILEETFRKSDIVTRYQADEFSIILPENNEPQTKDAVIRMKNKIEGREFVLKNTDAKMLFSVSIGVSTYQDSFEIETQMFDLAYTNMCKEKRNKVQGY